MMHFFKSKKFIIMIVSAIMMTSLGITANAESLLDQTLTYDSNKSAFLNYDPENDGLYDEYACIWASDELYYNSGEVNHS